MNKKAPSGAQAVLRAIALLKAFTLERPERDVAELSDETGLRRSTVHRLLAALESEGLVTKEATPGRYRLGPTAAALGVRALRSSKLHQTVHPVLEQLADEAGETATLEVFTEGKMLILDEVLGARLIGASPSLGTAWALHATSTGKALLAALSPARASEVLSTPLERFTSTTITDMTALEEELETIRRYGYAIAREELEEGYTAVGAVVHVPMVEPYAAISLGGPSARLEGEALEKLGTLVKTHADTVSKRLGFEESS